MAARKVGRLLLHRENPGKAVQCSNSQETMLSAAAQSRSTGRQPERSFEGNWRHRTM
jgi:hypothetical protein